MSEPFRSMWLSGFSFGAGVVALLVALVLFVSAMRTRRPAAEPEAAEPACCPHFEAAPEPEMLPEWSTHV